MLKECWKVTLLGFSLTRRNLPGISVKYKVGQTAQPAMGKLFCFSNKCDLVTFVELNYTRFEREDIIVFKGLAENPIPVKNVAQMTSFYFKDELENLGIPSALWPNQQISKAIIYWKLKKRKKRVPVSLTRCAPKGTLATRKFTPTEEYPWYSSWYDKPER